MGPCLKHRLHTKPPLRLEARCDRRRGGELAERLLYPEWLARLGGSGACELLVTPRRAWV